MIYESKIWSKAWIESLGPLGQRVAERIKVDIFRRLLPREPLVGAALADAYSVSKTPVREALSLLVRGGWWRRPVSRRVRNFTIEDVREIYEISSLLEPFALENTVPLMGENNRVLLSSLLDDADNAAKRGLGRPLRAQPRLPRRAADLLRTHVVEYEEQFVRALEHEPPNRKWDQSRGGSACGR